MDDWIEIEKCFLLGKLKQGCQASWKCQGNGCVMDMSGKCHGKKYFMSWKCQGNDLEGTQTFSFDPNKDVKLRKM